MREILFRGKRKDNNEWIEGNLSINKDSSDNGMPAPYCEEYRTVTYLIQCQNSYGGDIAKPIEVIPETVGQYINRLDAENAKIFEGCRCKYFIHADMMIAPEGKVEYLDDRWILRYSEHSYTDFMFINSKDILIIDNILDKEVK